MLVRILWIKYVIIIIMFLKGLGVFPVPWSSRWSWFLHLFLGRLMFFVLLVYIVVLVLVVCLCPSSAHDVATFSGTILFPLQCSVLPYFCLIHRFFSLSSFVSTELHLWVVYRFWNMVVSWRIVEHYAATFECLTISDLLNAPIKSWYL